MATNALEIACNKCCSPWPGLLLRWDDIPKYWIWFAYMDFLRYAWGGLMINEFEGQNTRIGRFEVLEYYSFDGENKWLFLLYQFLFFVGFMVAAWGALHRTYGRR
jgi:ATP-binding cassette, subfamily G (WHITE), member 2